MHFIAEDEYNEDSKDKKNEVYAQTNHGLEVKYPEYDNEDTKGDWSPSPGRSILTETTKGTNVKRV